MRRHAGLVVQLRYLSALAARFRRTLVAAGVLFGLAPLLFVWRYEGPGGERISFGYAFHHVYFLMFGQPSLPYVDDVLLEVMNLALPPVMFVVIVDGVVRFAYMYFAKHRNDKEWIEVVAQGLKGHIVVCGAGRVGYRVATRLLSLGEDVVVIERNESAAFVGLLRDGGVPVLIDDVRSPHSLKRTNVMAASAIVCATDDDLANLNIALDARRVNPRIRVVIRLFDDDLVTRVRESFKAEAFSSSALAAPALSLAALDPRIQHSFEVGGHLMVVSQFIVGRRLAELTLSQLRDRLGALALALLRADGAEVLHPTGDLQAAVGERLTLQCTYADYKKLRVFSDELTA